MILTASFLASLMGVLIYWRGLEETLTPGTSRRRGGGFSLRGISPMPRDVWLLTIVAALSAFGVRMIFDFSVVYAVR